jgi:hypothetical protein
MKIRILSSHILISFLLSSWSNNLINFVFIDRFFFIDRFRQFSWKSRYFRNLRIKLFSNRRRFAKSYSTYSISSVLTTIISDIISSRSELTTWNRSALSSEFSISITIFSYVRSIIFSTFSTKSTVTDTIYDLIDNSISIIRDKTHDKCRERL